MLLGLGLVLAVATLSLEPESEAPDLAPPRIAFAVDGAVRRSAWSLARASRAAESAGDLPAALDLARESYVKKPSRRGLERVDGLATRLAAGPAAGGGAH